MSDEPSICPVCQKDCSNPGGLAAHLQFTKDADHLAHRTGTEVAPQPAPSVVPDAVGASAPPPVVAGPPIERVAPTALSETENTLRPSDSPGEPRVLEFNLGPPPKVVPLLPPGPQPGATGGPRPAPVVVPLEPLIAGTVAAAVNGTILRGDYDGELTPQAVGETGFPKAAEACLRFYYPDLPLDHPVVALILSGASLSILIVNLKRANKPKDATAPVPQPQTTQTPTPSAPTPPPPPGASTGDPYWDAILSRAGGVANAQ